MGLTVNTNIASLVAQRNLITASKSVLSSMERLSSGYRINHAGDDIAGLSISEILRTQIRGNEMALRNAQDGASLLQVAEGNFVDITENVQRIRELTVQAANGTYTSQERRAIAQEVNQRIQQITMIAKNAKFNSIKLLDGTNSDTMLQIGANSTVSTNTLQISAALACATAGANGLSLTGVAITAAAGGVFENGSTARTFLTTIDAALTQAFTRRSVIGAYQSRLDSVISNLQVTIQNITASESRIRDVDVAAETSKLTKAQVIQQAAVSVLSQANQLPALALSLIGR